MSCRLRGDIAGLLSRAVEKYRRDGAVALLKSTYRFLRGGANVGGYQGLRTDNEMRWELIERYLDEDDDTLMDIGCAEGYFTNQAAELGLNARGVDGSEGRIAMARGKYRNKIGHGLEFEVKDISAKNVDSLPQADVVLFLTVQHHFEYEEGKDIFQALARKSKKMFYEPPGINFLGRRELEPKESIEVYTEFINSTLEGQVEVIDVTLVPRVDYDDRRDPLFVLDVSEYT